MTCRSRRTTDTHSTSTHYRLAPLCAPAIAIAGVMAIVLGAWTGPVAAQTSDGSEPIQLAITAQSTVVSADGVFVVELAVNRLAALTAADDDYKLTATVFDRLRTEGGVDLQPAVPIARFDAVSVADLERNRNGRLRIELPITAGNPDQPPAAGAVELADAGVYPITFDLTGPDGLVASNRTNLIRLPADKAGDVSQILGPVAVILAVTPDPPGEQSAENKSARGVPAGDQVDGAEPQLTVSQAVDVLADLPELPIAVLVESETVNQLSRRPNQAAALALALGDRPLFVGPAVELDPSALAEVGQGKIFSQAMEQTWAQARGIGLEPDTSVTVITRQLTAGGVEVLVDAGVTTAIDTSQSSTTNDVARVGEKELNLIRFEDDISSGFRVGDTASLTANRSLARLVLRYQTDRSPAVLRGDSAGVDQTNGLGVLLRWVDLLAGQGRARTELATDIEPTKVRRLAERPNQNLDVHRQLLDDIEQLLGSFTAMYDLQSQGNQPSGQTTPDDYRRDLRSALTLDLAPPERHRALLLFSEDLAGEIEVLALPVAQPVTMAASVGEVPVIIESRAAGPRRVMLQFRSDKVIVEQDQQLVLLDPGISSIDVKVQARTLGSSQLQMSVWTPDGRQVLASNQFQIRSTAVPGLGVLISIVAVALLIVWWVLDHRRRRRQAVVDLRVDETNNGHQDIHIFDVEVSVDKSRIPIAGPATNHSRRHPPPEPRSGPGRGLSKPTIK